MSAGDVDGDGRVDVVAANAGQAPSGGTGGASVTILRQTSPGSFVTTDIPVATARVASPSAISMWMV